MDALEWKLVIQYVFPINVGRPFSPPRWVCSRFVSDVRYVIRLGNCCADVIVN